MIRPIAGTDRPAVRALQGCLTYADPALVDAAIGGPFLGRIAGDRGRIVGYAIALPGSPMTLSELAVVPEARRNGHGRRLLDSTVSAAAADRVVVTTPVENETAKRFYRRLGFETFEVRSGFYADGADALRLRRRE